MIELCSADEQQLDQMQTAVDSGSEENPFFGKLWRVEDEVYRNFDAINHSILVGYMDCPAYAESLMTRGRKDTPAMKFGRATHTAILEPDKFDMLYGKQVPKPAEPARPAELKGKRERKSDPDCPVTQWKAEVYEPWQRDVAQWEKQKSDKETLNDGEFAALEVMRLKTVDDPFIGKLINDGWAEVCAFTPHPITGTWLKCKVDKYLPEKNLIVDLKSTKDNLEQFTKAIYYNDYEVQGAFYTDVVHLATGVEPRGYLVLGIQKHPPYEPMPLFLPKLALELGRTIYQQNLNAHEACVDQGFWPGYERTISIAEPPRWKLEKYHVEG